MWVLVGEYDDPDLPLAESHATYIFSSRWLDDLAGVAAHFAADGARVLLVERPARSRRLEAPDGEDAVLPGGEPCRT